MAKRRPNLQQPLPHLQQPLYSRGEWLCALVAVIIALVIIEVLDRFEWEIRFSLRVLHTFGRS